MLGYSITVGEGFLPLQVEILRKKLKCNIEEKKTTTTKQKKKQKVEMSRKKKSSDNVK